MITHNIYNVHFLQSLLANSAFKVVYKWTGLLNRYYKITHNIRNREPKHRNELWTCAIRPEMHKGHIYINHSNENKDTYTLVKKRFYFTFAYIYLYLKYTSVYIAKIYLTRFPVFERYEENL